MEIKEFRIGNWMLLYGQEVQITSLKEANPAYLGITHTPNSIGVTGGNILDPIELTEERLVKLGFQKCKDRLCIEAWAKGHPSQRFDIDFKDGKIIMSSRYQEHHDSLIMGHIKYVHQLQNLYFALTGTELIYKKD